MHTQFEYFMYTYIQIMSLLYYYLCFIGLKVLFKYMHIVYICLHLWINYACMYNYM